MTPLGPFRWILVLLAVHRRKLAHELSSALLDLGHVEFGDSRNVERLLSSSAVHLEPLLPWVSRDHHQQMQKADHLCVRLGSEAGCTFSVSGCTSSQIPCRK